MSANRSLPYLTPRSATASKVQGGYDLSVIIARGCFDGRAELCPHWHLARACTPVLRCRADENIGAIPSGHLSICRCTLQMHEKVSIAHQLSRLGVDVCEAGFPVASPGDFEAVSIIAREVGPELHGGRKEPMTIAGLARATQKDIDKCYEAIQHAPKKRIHTFLATSDIHVSGTTTGIQDSLRARATSRRWQLLASGTLKRALAIGETRMKIECSNLS